MVRIAGKERAKKIVLALCLALGLLTAIGGVYAQTTGDVESSVGTVSSSLLRILSGPVAKVVAAFLLIMTVVNLLKGKYGIAVASGLGFVILVLLPMFISWIQGAR